MAILPPNNAVWDPYTDPFGGLSAPPAYPTISTATYNIDRLRGLSIEHTLKTATYEISDYAYASVGSDEAFKDSIRHRLSSELAEEAMKVAKFTQIRDPINQSVRVIARVVIMTEDQLKKLISAVR